MNTPLVDTRGAARVRPITIAVLAMGGEGGGVLADWIIDLAEHGGYIAQMTSVPGVAQRTGATIYYVELFPKAAARDKKPVLALMPVPGDVDIVLASELMEAGRAITRGFVTPDRTTLIASTHRVYTMQERTALADGRVDAGAILKSIEEASRRLHAFDMASIADATGSLISAVLFGALAGSGALPFQRMAFEATIRRGGVGVEPSVRAFNAGFEAAASGNAPMPPAQLPFDPQARDGAVQKLVAPIDDALSIVSRPIVSAGVVRLADYQNEDYARLYLKRLEPVIAIEKARPGKPDELLTEVARNLALAMAYEDTVRVAELKIRASRFERVRKEVAVKDGQLLEIVEYMHPRTQEIAETLPASLGRFILNTGWVRGIVDAFTRKGRKVKTSSVRGFLLLYLVASMKPLRPRSLRWTDEEKRQSEWLAKVVEIAHEDYPLAVEAAHLIGLVKGYGDTHERGRQKYETLMALIPTLRARGNAANELGGVGERGGGGGGGGGGGERGGGGGG
ncbi:indolepyruvate oxidoreductase subunit beta family protein, partial [Pseudorhodoplanes sp.]|uniref:indolepyruvate oxidoreductase subunit beta family protein n=1 Tax=Pseudorhodoplanes sp. TaxID=1934341 RepID=UPI00391A157E